VNQIRFGLADANSGIDETKLSIKADFMVNGRPVEAELSDLAAIISRGIYQITLEQPLPVDQIERHIRAEVADNQGNIKRVNLRFFTGNPDIIFIDGFE
jgi:hypothetical protein